MKKQKEGCCKSEVVHFNLKRSAVGMGRVYASIGENIETYEVRCKLLSCIVAILLHNWDCVELFYMSCIGLRDLFLVALSYRILTE